MYPLSQLDVAPLQTTADEAKVESGTSPYSLPPFLPSQAVSPLATGVDTTAFLTPNWVAFSAAFH